MNFSEQFVRRPVATTLLAIGVALAGMTAYFHLPVSPLPQIDSPTITVSASMAGASPETMASAVATPLERQFGRIAGVTEMTSQSNLGTTGITLPRHVEHASQRGNSISFWQPKSASSKVIVRS